MTGPSMHVSKPSINHFNFLKQHMVQQPMLKHWSGGVGGKGAGKVASQQVQDIERLKSIDNSLKCWVGCISQKTTWKELQQHFAQVAPPKYAAVFKGTGCVAFASSDDAALAISMLDGSKLGGVSIQVDAFKGNPKAKA